MHSGRQTFKISILTSQVVYNSMSIPALQPSKMLALAASCALLATAQEPAPPPDLVREKLVQWVETKKLISREEAGWKAEKEMLESLITVREKEAAEMDKVVSLARERVADVEKQGSRLEEEFLQRKAWRETLEKRVVALEKALLPRLASLPPPLLEKMNDAVTRLRDPARDPADLQGRFRDLLAILGECSAFNSRLTYLPEIREIGGQKYEVDVLYLGMSQAWYVDRDGTESGTGVPGPAGWVWVEDRSIAPRVRRAIDIHLKKEAPVFSRLPLANGKEAAP